MSGRRIDVVTGEETTVLDDTPVPEPAMPQSALRRMVRRERQRRIDEAFPDNLEYPLAWSFLYLDTPESERTPQQETRWDNVIKPRLQQVVAIHDAARAILQLDPIPSDFDDDARWP